MRLLRLFGLLLIIAGVLALGVGHFSYTKATHEVKIGPIALAVKEVQDVELPAWAGVTAIAVGALLALMGGRRR
jgi:hypothetical protein